MTTVKIEGHASGSGSATVKAPNTDEDRTLNLPDANVTIPSGLPGTDAGYSKNALTTTGDVLYASGANTLARLGVGSTGDVLTVASGVPSWAAAAAGGKILQIQAHTLADEPTQINSNTDTWVDTGLTQTIELADNTNKVLVIGNLTVGNDSFGGWSAASGNNGQFTINRAAGTDPGNKGTYVFETFQDTMREHAAFIYLDSPTSTDELTYKIQFRRRSAYSGSTNVYVFGGGSVTNSLYLLEVDAT